MARKDLIQHRRDTAANWTSVNPVLAASELGFETDTNKFKLGDGTSTWIALAYQGGGGSGVSLTPSATQTIVAQNATTTPLIVQAAATPSVDTFAVQNSAGNKVLQVTSGNAVNIGVPGTAAVNIGNSATSVGILGSVTIGSTGATTTFNGVPFFNGSVNFANQVSFTSVPPRMFSNGSYSAYFYNSQSDANTFVNARMRTDGVLQAQGVEITNPDTTYGAVVQGLGYGANTGGTVTQNTSKSTGVSLSKLCGTITMNAASLAAGTIVSFTLTNTFIKATDVLILNHSSGGTLGAYTLNASAGASNATIYVRNNTLTPLSEAIVIRFAIINAVIA